MTQLLLDHIAVSGRSLEDARAHCEEALGVALLPGGKHPFFGTHNCLLGLADGFYLEAIAIDPEAPVPDRPRWFDLDRFDGVARVTNWICATPDLEAVLRDLPEGAGEPVALNRGALRWRMAVPSSGILPYDNMHPAVIEWQSDTHPSALLAASGCTLRRLVVSHPQASTLREFLAPKLADARVVFEVGPVGLMAEIDTAQGLRVLR